MAVLLLPLSFELHHASEHHGHHHCDITANHFDSHDESCSHLHFLSEINAIDFANSKEESHTHLYSTEITFSTVEVEESTLQTAQERGPPFLLFT